MYPLRNWGCPNQNWIKHKHLKNPTTFHLSCHSQGFCSIHGRSEFWHGTRRPEVSNNPGLCTVVRKVLYINVKQDQASFSRPVGNCSWQFILRVLWWDASPGLPFKIQWIIHKLYRLIPSLQKNWWPLYSLLCYCKTLQGSTTVLLKCHSNYCAPWNIKFCGARKWAKSHFDFSSVIRYYMN